MPSQVEMNHLMVELRPRLHRYCARMIGSAIDGEDLVQETLARAAAALPGAGLIERPESWLFRIAHNVAIDALRARRRQAALASEAEAGDAVGESSPADARVAAAASLATFLLLPPTPRSSVLLVDVLGHSAVETAEILGINVAAVKAGLHRGRGRLREIVEMPAEPPRFDKAEKLRLRAYADSFNARDFDRLRGLLAEDVKLDLVNRLSLAGRKDVSVYFGRYDAVFDWHVAVGLAEGRPALLFRDPADSEGRIGHIVLLSWAEGQITGIRDFKFAGYVMEGLVIGEL
ncbi:RNA polymerase sigma factor [Bosea sp. BK604]|uniref:RNA polymerase sigma factor n=1 Tax=Bosea sp. BK604 TaxID=2512180 RepID=UPI001046B091|nr:RNA polymerase sigma factor [Bosea sp. BK604]TCR61686.1 RNA polymerase ECF family sigma subunit [Bosea sp. BK604]